MNTHTFFIAADILEGSNITLLEDVEDEWCYKCKKFYDCCQEVASQVGLVVVDGLYSTKIKLICQKKKHEMTISYTKKLQTLSCSECKREEREENKEKQRIEEQRRAEEYERKQKELFEKARIEMERNKDHHTESSSWQSSSSSSNNNNRNSNCNRRNLEYYTLLEKQIND